MRSLIWIKSSLDVIQELGQDQEIDAIASSIASVIETTDAYAIARIEGRGSGQSFCIDDVYVLQAGISSEVVEGFESVGFSLPGLEKNIEFEIVVYAEDMDVQPTWVQQYSFSRTEKSSLLEFRLRPRVQGIKQIRVEFYYQRHWLAKIQFEVAVAETPELALV